MKRIGNADEYLMPEGDWSELTVAQWGDAQYDYGRISGFDTGVSAVVNRIRELSGEEFVKGNDEKAKALRDLASHLKERIQYNK